MFLHENHALPFSSYPGGALLSVLPPRALPLTVLNDALRAVGCFLLALRLFKWR